jgi:hypothetical protein
MRFEVFTVVKLVLWVVMSCGFVDKYPCFGGTYCCHLQGTSSLKMETVCFSETFISTYSLQTLLQRKPTSPFFSLFQKRNVFTWSSVSVVVKVWWTRRVFVGGGGEEGVCAERPNRRGRKYGGGSVVLRSVMTRIPSAVALRLLKHLSLSLSLCKGFGFPYARVIYTLPSCCNRRAVHSTLRDPSGNIPFVSAVQ